MNDEDFALELAARALEEKKIHMGINLLESLKKLITAIKNNGATWMKIFNQMNQVVSIVLTHMPNWQKIAEEVWKLFFVDTTTLPPDLVGSLTPTV